MVLGQLRIPLHGLLCRAGAAPSQSKLDEPAGRTRCRGLGLSTGLCRPANQRLAQHVKDAARLMTNAKFHAQTICYLDLEDGTEPSGNYAGYMSAWVTALQGEGYVPGIYCSHLIADWCRRKTTISGPSDCRWGQGAIPIRQIKFQRASLPTEQSRRNTARTSSCAARRRRSTLMLLP